MVHGIFTFQVKLSTTPTTIAFSNHTETVFQALLDLINIHTSMEQTHKVSLQMPQTVPTLTYIIVKVH